MKLANEKLHSQALQEINEVSGEKVGDCYQCGKCSAACPVCQAMDILPHQVLRYLQLGLLEEVLASKTIWICASCFTCAARCPRDVDLANVMEGLRLYLLRQRGQSRLKAEDMPGLLKKGMPEQGVVSGFRKYAK